MIKQRRKVVGFGLVFMLFLSAIIAIFLVNPQTAFAESPNRQDESAFSKSSIDFDINGNKSNIADYESYSANIPIYATGNAISFTVSHGEGYTFAFNCGTTDTYYFKLGSTTIIEYDVEMYYMDNDQKSIVDFQDLGMLEQIGNNTTFVCQYSSYFTAGKTYYIYMESYSGDVDISAQLVIPTIIKDVTIGSEYIIRDGKTVSGLNAIMDTSNIISITYNDNATIKVTDMKMSDSENPNEIGSILNGCFKVGFNKNAENKNICIVLEDDKGIKTISMSVKYPYYATATINDDYVYELFVTDSYGNALSSNGYEKMVVKYLENSLSLTTKTYDMLRLPIFETTTITADAYFATDNYSYSVPVPGVSYNVYSYTLSPNLSIHGDKTRIVIEANVSNTSSNMLISIPDGVKAVFINGNQGRTFTNLTIEYNGTSVGYLYTNNLNISGANTNRSYAIYSYRNDLTWEIINTNNISASVIDYVVRSSSSTNGFTFIGNGILRVTGNAGANGNNSAGSRGTHAVYSGKIGFAQKFSGNIYFTGGKGCEGSLGTGNGGAGQNGGAGGNALQCNSLSYAGTGKVYLQGGNGGNGGNGANGYSGTDANNTGIYYSLLEKSTPISGTVQPLLIQNTVNKPASPGGHGGNGGNGGDAGLSININVSLNGITIYSVNKGNGGDGGHGGSGGDGSEAKSEPTVPITYYPAQLPKEGGVGGNGGDGNRGGKGGSGGQGGAGGSNNHYCENGGDGGHGGKSFGNEYGGAGGAGGTGRFGGRGGMGGSSEKSYGGAGGNGGNGLEGGAGGAGGAGGSGLYGGDGGHGGNGGNGHADNAVEGDMSTNGGDGGNGGSGGYSYATSTIARPGNGGNGGVGGDIGSWGPGRRGGNGGKGYNGGRGGDGSKGMGAWQAGGSGGNGGDAYGGTVGYGGSKGENGHPWGAQGSNGANGNYYPMSNYKN